MSNEAKSADSAIRRSDSCRRTRTQHIEFVVKAGLLPAKIGGAFGNGGTERSRIELDGFTRHADISTCLRGFPKTYAWRHVGTAPLGPRRRIGHYDEQIRRPIEMMRLCETNRAAVAYVNRFGARGTLSLLKRTICYAKPRCLGLRFYTPDGDTILHLAVAQHFSYPRGFCLRGFALSQQIVPMQRAKLINSADWATEKMRRRRA